MNNQPRNSFPATDKKSGAEAFEPPQGPVQYDMHILTGNQKRWTEIRIAWHVFILALRNYGSLNQSCKVVKALYFSRKQILGNIEPKIVKVGPKFYHSIYAPGYPSLAFDKYIEGEFHRIRPLSRKVNILSFIFFAVTSKCPLRCEHCFEWNNLNKPESFSLQELKAVVAKFQDDGIAQFHLSGGEPMVRWKDLEQLVTSGRKDSEFYVLTSGFNFTAANSRSLKQAGLSGVIISLDHFDPDIHNAFRGSPNSFKEATQAIKHAQEQNLMVGLTVCATRAFISRYNLLKYAELARILKVPFIQILEPKAIGHYEGKDVGLEPEHLMLLDEFYYSMNSDPAFKEYPVIIYHGYHQRRIGCLSGGNRTLYIDSEGFVNACPFCHSKNFNIKDAIYPDVSIHDRLKAMTCQRYQNAAL